MKAWEAAAGLMGHVPVLPRQVETGQNGSNNHDIRRGQYKRQVLMCYPSSLLDEHRQPLNYLEHTLNGNYYAYLRRVYGEDNLSVAAHGAPYQVEILLRDYSVLQKINHRLPGLGRIAINGS